MRACIQECAEDYDETWSSKIYHFLKESRAEGRQDFRSLNNTVYSRTSTTVYAMAAYQNPSDFASHCPDREVLIIQEICNSSEVPHD